MNVPWKAIGSHQPVSWSTRYTRTVSLATSERASTTIVSPMPLTSWIVDSLADRSWMARSRAARSSTAAMSFALPMAVAIVSPKLRASAVSSGLHSYGAAW